MTKFESHVRSRSRLKRIKRVSIVHLYESNLTNNSKKQLFFLATEERILIFIFSFQNQPPLIIFINLLRNFLSIQFFFSFFKQKMI